MLNWQGESHAKECEEDTMLGTTTAVPMLQHSVPIHSPSSRPIHFEHTGVHWVTSSQWTLPWPLLQRSIIPHSFVLTFVLTAHFVSGSSETTYLRCHSHIRSMSLSGSYKLSDSPQYSHRIQDYQFPSTDVMLFPLKLQICFKLNSHDLLYRDDC